MATSMPAVPPATRRLVFAGVLAAAVTLAPGLGFFAAAPGSHLANSTGSNCRSGESMDAYSLQCVPDIAPNTGGAPSEMGVTNATPGIASPTHGGTPSTAGGV